MPPRGSQSYMSGIFSSGIAYTLQIAGQKYADPAVASIVMSLESVFAVLGGFVVLHEVLATAGNRRLRACVHRSDLGTGAADAKVEAII